MFLIYSFVLCYRLASYIKIITFYIRNLRYIKISYPVAEIATGKTSKDTFLVTVKCCNYLLAT